SRRFTQIFTDAENQIRESVFHLWLAKYFLQDDRLSLSHHEDFFMDAVSASACEQSLRRFMERLKTQAESPIMHRYQSLGAKFEKGLHRFFRVHVNFPTAGRFVGADGKQGDIDLVAVADFLESRKVCAVAAVKNG